MSRKDVIFYHIEIPDYMSSSSKKIGRRTPKRWHCHRRIEYFACLESEYIISRQRHFPLKNNNVTQSPMVFCMHVGTKPNSFTNQRTDIWIFFRILSTFDTFLHAVSVTGLSHADSPQILSIRNACNVRNSQAKKIIPVKTFDYVFLHILFCYPLVCPLQSRHPITRYHCLDTVVFLFLNLQTSVAVYGMHQQFKPRLRGKFWIKSQDRPTHCTLVSKLHRDTPTQFPFTSFCPLRVPVPGPSNRGPWMAGQNAEKASPLKASVGPAIRTQQGATWGLRMRTTLPLLSCDLESGPSPVFRLLFGACRLKI